MSALKAHPAISVFEIRGTFFVSSPAGVHEITRPVHDLLKSAKEGISKKKSKASRTLVDQAKAAGFLVDRDIISDPLSAVFDFLSDYRSRIHAKSRVSEIETIVAIGDGMIASTFQSLIPPDLCDFDQVSDYAAFVEYCRKNQTADGTLIVFCPDLVNRTDLLEINHICVSQKNPWLPVIVNSTSLCVGPLIHPGATACMECALIRANANSVASETMGVLTEFPFGEAGWPTANAPKAAALAAASLAAVQCEKSVRGMNDLDGGGEFYVFNLVGMDGYKSEILRVPRCPTCGSISDNDPIHAFLHRM